VAVVEEAQPAISEETQKRIMDLPTCKESENLLKIRHSVSCSQLVTLAQEHPQNQHLCVCTVLWNSPGVCFLFHKMSWFQESNYRDSENVATPRPFAGTSSRPTVMCVKGIGKQRFDKTLVIQCDEFGAIAHGLLVVKFCQRALSIMIP